MRERQRERKKDRERAREGSTYCSVNLQTKIEKYSLFLPNSPMTLMLGQGHQNWCKCTKCDRDRRVSRTKPHKLMKIVPGEKMDKQIR